MREVLSIAWAIDEGNLGAVLGTDPPHQLLVACGIYKHARDATQADEMQCQKDEREQAARHSAVSQKR